MNTTAINKCAVVMTMGVDAMMIAAACAIPAFSHLTAVPLYQANPMLMILLGGMLLVRDRRNAYVMAVLLPLASSLLVGMPSMGKVLCMVPEYLTVVALFGLLNKRMGGSVMKTAAEMLLAMVAGKVVYYGLKAVVLGSLVATPLALQVVVMMVAALTFALIYTRKQNR